MARIYRTIRLQLLKSESLGRCSRDARYLFVGLILRSDDFGRAPAPTALIRADVFPYDDDVTKDMVEQWLRELYDVGAIRFYQANGSHYIELPGWSKYQYVQHANKAKDLMPEPVGEERIAPPFVQETLFSGGTQPPLELPPGPPSVDPHEDVRRASSTLTPEVEVEVEEDREGKDQLLNGQDREIRDRGEGADPIPAATPKPSPKRKPKAKAKPKAIDELWGTRPDVERLLTKLADLVHAAGLKRPNERQVAWHTAMRLLLDTDLADHHAPEGSELTDEQHRERMVAWALDWCHRPGPTGGLFWADKIQSAPNLREKWPTIYLQIVKQRAQANGAGAPASAKDAERHERTARRMGRRRSGPAVPVPAQIEGGHQ